MKILQVGLGNNPGGVEAFVMNYYRELAGQGISFDFVSMYGKIAYEEEILRLGGRVFYVPNVKKDYFGYVKQLKALLDREKYDVVHVNMLSAANIVPLRLAHQAGVRKVIAHSHSTFAPGLARGLLDKVNRKGLNQYADRKLACSEKAGRWLFGDNAFDSGQVRLVQNAIDLDRYGFSPESRSELRGKYGWEGCLVVGHVGRFQTEKNHSAIGEIFREAVNKDPRVRLCLVGDGELRGQIQEKLEKEGLSEKVLFAGVRQDVEKYLCAMDVFLFPSLYEALPFTVLEAQASGLPCVISDTIPREAVLAEENVTALSLDAGWGRWADVVLEYGRRGRTDGRMTADRFKEAHLDIKEEASRLLAIYGD